jgi:hypothetical protein
MAPSEFPFPAQIIQLIEEQGRKGRELLFEHQAPQRIPRLCSALAIAESPHVRRVLCNLLASLSDAGALQCLLVCLDDAEGAVVSAAADAIGNCSYGKDIDPALRTRIGKRLLELANNASQALEVRTGAIYALGLLRYVPALATLLRARSRASAGQALRHWRISASGWPSLPCACGTPARATNASSPISRGHSISWEGRRRIKSSLMTCISPTCDTASCGTN